MINRDKLKRTLLAIVPTCPPVLSDGTGGCGWPELSLLAKNIVELLLWGAIPLAVLVILYGGFMVLTAAGSESRYMTGRKAIIGAVVGLFIVFGSLILINLIWEALGIKK